MATSELGGRGPAIDEVQQTTLADRWILSRLAKLTSDVTRLIDELQLGEAGRQVHDFFWSDYWDWYVEIAKEQMQGDEAIRRATAGTPRGTLGLRILVRSAPIAHLVAQGSGHRFHSAPP